MSSRIVIPLKRDRYENDEAELELVKMLHCIIHGVPVRKVDEGDVPYKKENGNWQIDSSNDWWASFENGELTIMYRYGGDRLQALGTWLCKFFD